MPTGAAAGAVPRRALKCQDGRVHRSHTKRGTPERINESVVWDTRSSVLPLVLMMLTGARMLPSLPAYAYLSRIFRFLSAWSIVMR